MSKLNKLIVKQKKVEVLSKQRLSKENQMLLVPIRTTLSINDAL